MSRFSRSDIEEIDSVYEGTAAAFVGYNTQTGKKGIYKENGAMLGITNEDIREKLTSDILHILGIDCADIDLVYDETTGQNSCFSNYIISDDEILVSPEVVYPQNVTEDRIEDFFQSYLEGIKKLTSDTEIHKQCRKNYYNYAYVGCILDLYDLKSDNLPLIFNKNTGKYSISPWFDFGTAFKEGARQKQAFFLEMPTDEVMTILSEKHKEDILEIASRINTLLTPEKIDELLSKDYIVETLEESEIEQIKNRLNNQIQKSQKLELTRITDEKGNSKGLRTFLSSVKEKLTNMFSRKKDVKLLSANSKQYENKETTMHSLLERSTKTAEEVARYDVTDEEPNREKQKNIYVEEK